MSTLHILSRHPSTNNSLNGCLRTLGEQDTVLLMGDGVYALLDHSLTQAPVDIRYLEQDRIARAVPKCPQAEGIDMETFVALSAKHHNAQTWQ